MTTPSLPARVEAVSIRALFVQFLVIGAVSFGGGVVAYEHDLLVTKKKWLSEDEFKAALAISQTMPGLNSVNLAVLAGDRLRGVLGATVAAMGILLPGSLFVLVAGIFYSANTDLHFANVLLAGIAACATGLLAAITYQLGGENMRHARSLILAVGAFLLMSICKMSLIYVLLIVVPIGLFLYRPGRAL